MMTSPRVTRVINIIDFERESISTKEYERKRESEHGSVNTRVARQVHLHESISVCALVHMLLSLQTLKLHVSKCAFV